MKAARRLSLILIFQVAFTVSCSAKPSTPSQTAKKFINYVAEQNVDKAVELLSSNAINKAGGMNGAKTFLHTSLFDFRNRIEKLEVLSMNMGRENLAAEQAEVEVGTNVRATMKEGLDSGAMPEELQFEFRFRFVKENQDWKVDHVVAQELSRARQNAPTQTATTQAPNLDNEAVAAAKELWEQHTTKCGDSYYGRVDFRGIITFHEYKNVSFIPKRRGPATEADRMNGVLWNGEVEILTRLYRENHEGTWSNWKERTPGGGFPIGATKRQSGWSATQLMEITNQQRVKCSDVPG